MAANMWLGVLAVSVLIARVTSEVVAPWWSNAVYYRILIDSFKDGDGDGLGDLQGATQQISYVRAFGTDAVILSPFCAMSTDCTKPGPVNLIEIDQRYGNLDKLTALLTKAKKLELKVVVTIPLQTMSIESEWFTSSANRDSGYEDWILWKNGSGEDTPTEEDGVDKWVWHETRGAFWASSNNAAVLNLCSEGVAAALSAALCAWLRRGAAGVMLNPDFPPNQTCGEKLLSKLAAEAMSCVRAANLDTPLILAQSSLPSSEAAKYYSGSGVGANSVISNALTSTTRKSAAEMAIEFYTALLYSPDDFYPSWLTSTEDGNRIATRYGSDVIDAINLIALTLPGAAVIQQGDELGVADTILEWASSSDKCWPTPARPSAAPFPWEDSTNAGFTSGEPWLPLAPNYRYANAKSEYSNDLSHIAVVKTAAAMRKSPAMGPHTEIKRLGEAIAILRWGGAGILLVVSNLAKVQTEAEISKYPGLPHEMIVAASSSGSAFTTGSHVTLDKSLKLASGETVLLVGGPRHCGGPGPVDKIANKLSEGWQKINKYFSNL